MAQRKTVDAYELSEYIEKQQREINQRLHDKAFADESSVHDYIRINPSTHSSWFKKEPLTFKVNWCCIGESEPDIAIAFAEALREASEFCQNCKYNGFYVTFEGKERS